MNRRAIDGYLPARGDRDAVSPGRPRVSGSRIKAVALLASVVRPSP